MVFTLKHIYFLLVILLNFFNISSSFASDSLTLKVVFTGKLSSNKTVFFKFLNSNNFTKVQGTNYYILDSSEHTLLKNERLGDLIIHTQTKIFGIRFTNREKLIILPEMRDYLVIQKTDAIIGNKYIWYWVDEIEFVRTVNKLSG
jgi:hypothetical protein